MNYQLKAHSIAHNEAVIEVKDERVKFGITPSTKDTLPNPAELFLGAFASCILKNVERFSSILKFSYTKAEIEVNAERLEHPPRMDQINYKLMIFSDDDNLNIDLLKKNIEKFGTIYNTVKRSSTITGTINKRSNV